MVDSNTRDSRSGPEEQSEETQHNRQVQRGGLVWRCGRGRKKTKSKQEGVREGDSLCFRSIVQVTARCVTKSTPKTRCCATVDSITDLLAET
jgi:hypothetical protein